MEKLPQNIFSVTLTTEENSVASVMLNQTLRLCFSDIPHPGEYKKPTLNPEYAKN